MEERPRARAHKLYNVIAEAYGSAPKRWASADGAARAVDRVALPYSLKQLSEWLSRGGMALSAPAFCACTAVGGGSAIDAFCKCRVFSCVCCQKVSCYEISSRMWLAVHLHCCMTLSLNMHAVKRMSASALGTFCFLMRHCSQRA